MIFVCVLINPYCTSVINIKCQLSQNSRNIWTLHDRANLNVLNDMKKIDHCRIDYEQWRWIISNDIGQKFKTNIIINSKYYCLCLENMIFWQFLNDFSSFNNSKKNWIIVLVLIIHKKIELFIYIFD